MTLVSNIKELTEGIALELNSRPITKETMLEPENPQPGQFWIRPEDGALTKYSVATQRFEPVTAVTTPETIIDGGNF